MLDAAALPMRDGTITVSRLIDLYMAHYAGRDGSRLQRLSWWSAKLGELTLATVSDDVDSFPKLGHFGTRSR